jgi:hypothetical protein
MLSSRNGKAASGGNRAERTHQRQQELPHDSILGRAIAVWVVIPVVVSRAHRAERTHPSQQELLHDPVSREKEWD